MATTVGNYEVEDEDFITCGFCKCEYDAVNKKPKFLPCAHTVCLFCLQDLYPDGIITCPFCCKTFSKKDDFDSIPNNHYALKMLKTKYQERKPTTANLPSNPLTGANRWCLTCGSPGKVECALSNHISVDLTNPATDTIIKNLETFYKLHIEFNKLNDISIKKMAVAVEKREEVDKQVKFLQNSVVDVYKSLKEISEKNSLKLKEIKYAKDKNIQLKEENKAGSSKMDHPQQIKDKCLTQLMTLVENSCPGDTIETLKSKMNKSVKRWEEESREAVALASEFKLRQKIKIFIRLTNENDQPIPTLLEEGFRFNPSLDTHKDLALVSHSIFTFLKQQNIELKSVPPTSNTSSLSVDSQLLSRKSYTPGQSYFILSLIKLDTLIGRIYFRPVSTFYDPIFVIALGEYCFKSPKHFENPIEKAISRTFVMFNLSKIVNLPPAPRVFERSSQNVKPYTKPVKDIGIVGLKFIKPNVSSDWGFFFPLNEFANYKKKSKHLLYSSVLPGEVFGNVLYVEQMLDVMTPVSGASGIQRVNYSVTLESL